MPYRKYVASLGGFEQKEENAEGMRESISVLKCTGGGLIKERLLSIHSLLWLATKENISTKACKVTNIRSICNLGCYKSQVKNVRQRNRAGKICEID